MATNPEEPAYWVDEVPTVDIKAGVCMVSLQTGGRTIELRCTPATLMGTVWAANRAIAEFNASERAAVIPIKAKRKRRGEH